MAKLGLALSCDYRSLMERIFSACKNRADLIPAFVKSLFLREPFSPQLDNLGNPIPTHGFLFDYLFYARHGESAVISEAEAKSIFKRLCEITIYDFPFECDCMTENLKNERFSADSLEDLLIAIDEADSFRFATIEYAIRTFVCDFLRGGMTSNAQILELFSIAEIIFIRNDKNARERNLGVCYSWEDFFAMVDEKILSEVVKSLKKE